MPKEVKVLMANAAGGQVVTMVQAGGLSMEAIPPMPVEAAAHVAGEMLIAALRGAGADPRALGRVLDAVEASGALGALSDAFTRATQG